MVNKDIRKIRRECKVNQKKMAKHLGVSLYKYQKMERGLEDFPRDIIFKIARKLEISPALIGGDERGELAKLFSEEGWDKSIVDTLGEIDNIIELYTS